jgi:hypothetical protein
MKKIIFALIFIFAAGPAFADWYMYRKAGGEVVSVSKNPQEPEITSKFAEVQASNGLNLSLGYIYSANSVRLATAEEKAAWPFYEQADKITEYRARVKASFASGNLLSPGEKLLIERFVWHLNTQHGMNVTRQQVINAINQDIDDGKAD